MNSNSSLKSLNSGEQSELHTLIYRQFTDMTCSAALKVAEVDLAAARNHVEQFKEISQASEAALAALSSTHDEYQASTEAELTRRQVDTPLSRSYVVPLTELFPSRRILSPYKRGSVLRRSALAS